MKKPLVVNLIGAPGCGKSTMAAKIFYELKLKGIKCELITEYAKDRVFEENSLALNDQLYIFAKQNHRQFKLINKADVIITDAPLIMSLYYGKNLSDSFKNFVLEIFNEYNNINYFLNRKHAYEEFGRLQTENEANNISSELLYLVKDKIDFKFFDTDQDSKLLINDIISIINMEDNNGNFIYK